MKIGITFGALAPRIKEQLPDSVKIERRKLLHLQADANAVTRLFIRGILNDSETRKARQRIMKLIMRDAVKTKEAPR